MAVFMVFYIVTAPLLLLASLIQNLLISLVAYIVVSFPMTDKLAYYSTLGHNRKASKSWQPNMTYKALGFPGLWE